VEVIIRLKRAVQLDPGHAHAWVGIGTAYHRMRKPEQALAAFEKAVEANPDDGYTRRNLGGLLIGFKRIGEAVSLFGATGHWKGLAQVGLHVGLVDCGTVHPAIQANADRWSRR
jgi:tetratricopeptide (TPR) repeat protein